MEVEEMPDYIKRGRWLRGVAFHLEDETLSALLRDCADRMIDVAHSNNRTPRLQIIQENRQPGELDEYSVC
jgi:hypothetical protein